MHCIQEEKNIFVRAERLLDHMHRRSDDDFARFHFAVRSVHQEHILKYLEHFSDSVSESESRNVDGSRAAVTVQPSEVEHLPLPEEIAPLSEQMEIEQPHDDKEPKQQNECNLLTLRHSVEFFLLLCRMKSVLQSSVL